MVTGCFQPITAPSRYASPRWRFNNGSVGPTQLPHFRHQVIELGIARRRRSPRGLFQKHLLTIRKNALSRNQGCSGSAISQKMTTQRVDCQNASDRCYGACRRIGTKNKPILGQRSIHVRKRHPGLNANDKFLAIDVNHTSHESRKIKYDSRS